MMKHYALLFLMFVCMYLVPLGLRPMIMPDEFRYAEIPREMIESGDWVVPRLAGMDYFEKPAFGYQLTAVSFKIFGYNRFALRLPAALAAALTALLIALFLRRYTHNDRLAALGGILYLDFGLVYALGTCAVLDAQLACFIAGTLAAFLPACLSPKWDMPKIVLLLVSGVFAGLGFMTKGFVALAVPALTIVPFLVWEKRWRDFLVLPWLPSAACLAVCAPWAIAVHRQAPDFWRYFVVVEHLNRFLDPAASDQHAEGWWFYLVLLIPMLLPGGLLLGCAARGLRGKWGELLKAPHVRYLVCWFAVPFLFFSVCRGKLPTYILPCFFPVAALGAIGLSEYFRLGGRYRSFRWVMNGFGILLILAGIVLAFAEKLPLPGELPFIPETLLRFIPAGVAAVIFGIVLLWQRNKSWSRNLAAFFAGQAAVVVLMLWAATPELFGDKTPEDALARLSKHIPADARILAHRGAMHGAVWTLHKPHDITLCWNEHEWEYAIKRNAGARYIDRKDLMKFLAAPENRPCVLLMSEDFWRRRREELPPDGQLYFDTQMALAVYPAKEAK